MAPAQEDSGSVEKDGKSGTPKLGTVKPAGCQWEDSTVTQVTDSGPAPGPATLFVALTPLL